MNHISGSMFWINNIFLKKRLFGMSSLNDFVNVSWLSCLKKAKDLDGCNNDLFFSVLSTICGSLKIETNFGL